MKILKPGKVEQRKFECPECGCVFVAEKCEAVNLVGQDGNTTISIPYYVECPCSEVMLWNDGEPYEGPSQDVQGDALRLYELMKEVWPYSIGALDVLSKLLADNGVTFRKE